MQGLVARAYGHLTHAAYLLLDVRQPEAARSWLAQLAGVVNRADVGAEDKPCVNVAFTWGGLRRLGLPEEALATFPRPLQEGMVTEHRSRLLGDTGPNDPAGWRWGRPQPDPGPQVGALLMIFAGSEEALAEEQARHQAAYSANGGLVDAADPITGLVLDEGGHEHFGFADGISQPVIEGWPVSTSSQRPPAPAPPPKWTRVMPGEVVLGHPDNFGKSAAGPTVAASADPAGLLPEDPSGRKGRHHLGQNGSWLVFRQLAQDVAGFNHFLQATAGAGGPGLDAGQLGAKLVGRWPDGAPLVLACHGDDPSLTGANDFGYHDTDQAGLCCPLGAHVRRSNPRDSTTHDPGAALHTTKNHRILRRGRPYGMRMADPPGPGQAEGDERGLLFICLNTDIERQFEFVQHTWLQNRTFGGLYDEVDAVVGTQPEGGGRFTVQRQPVRNRVEGIGNFVTVKGGAYFFLPGLRALRYLASMA